MTKTKLMKTFKVLALAGAVSLAGVSSVYANAQLSVAVQGELATALKNVATRQAATQLIGAQLNNAVGGVFVGSSSQIALLSANASKELATAILNISKGVQASSVAKYVEANKGKAFSSFLVTTSVDTSIATAPSAGGNVSQVERIVSLMASKGMNTPAGTVKAALNMNLLDKTFEKCLAEFTDKTAITTVQTVVNQASKVSSIGAVGPSAIQELKSVYPGESESQIGNRLKAGTANGNECQMINPAAYVDIAA